MLDSSFRLGWYFRCQRILARGFACFISAAVAWAGTESETEIERGCAELSAGKPIRALQYFEKAGRLDKTNANIFFYQGVALNRVGSHATALGRLQRAATLGCDLPDLHLEIAWAHLQNKRWTDAIAAWEKAPAQFSNSDANEVPPTWSISTKSRFHEAIERAYVVVHSRRKTAPDEFASKKQTVEESELPSEIAVRFLLQTIPELSPFDIRQDTLAVLNHLSPTVPFIDRHGRAPIAPEIIPYDFGNLQAAIAAAEAIQPVRWFPSSIVKSKHILNPFEQAKRFNSSPKQADTGPVMVAKARPQFGVSVGKTFLSPSRFVPPRREPKSMMVASHSPKPAKSLRPISPGMLPRLDRKSLIATTHRPSPQVSESVGVLGPSGATEASKRGPVDNLHQTQSYDFESTDGWFERLEWSHLYLLSRASAPNSSVEKPWFVTATVAGGYDSDYVTLDNLPSLPAELRRTHAWVWRSVVNAGYRWDIGDSGQFDIGYEFMGDALDSVPENFRQDHYSYLQYSHQISPRLRSIVRFSEEFTHTDGDTARNQLAGRFAFQIQTTEWMTAEIASTFAWNEFGGGAGGDLDRDGVSPAVALLLYFSPPERPWRIRAGYRHTWNVADGKDFDYQSDAFLIAISRPLFEKVTGEFLYLHSWYRFPQRNILQFVACDCNESDGHTDSVSLQISRPINDWLVAFLQFHFNLDNFEDSPFDNHRYRFFVGLRSIF